MSNQTDFFKEELNLLYLPMHADNWAYFLSTGYIGGAYLENLSSDFQNNNDSLISGFKSFPPMWAVNIGDVGNLGKIGNTENIGSIANMGKYGKYGKMKNMGHIGK